MKSLKNIISDIKVFPVFLICIILLFLFILYQKEITSGCLEAIKICLDIIIPTLFPVQMITYLMLYTGIPTNIKAKIHRITIRLFGLSGNCAEGILIGLTGGYNAAIKTATALRKNNSITQEEAKKLAVYFSNPGISFCVLIFGITIFNSIGLGIFIFAISILIGLVTAFFLCKKCNSAFKESVSNKRSISDCIILSVNQAGKTLISICLWIITFSIIKSVIKCIIPTESIIRLFEVFADISTGIFIAADNYSLPFCVFALLSGGICILLQQAEDIRYLKISLIELLSVKLVNACSVSLITSFMLRLNIFSKVLETISYQTKLLSGTPISSLSLVLLLCILFSLTTERKKYVYPKY